MIDKWKNLFWKVDGMDFTDNPPEATGVFHLKYEDQFIGILSYKNEQWTFQYSEDFKKNKPLDPLISFPDIEKIYINNQLWPFFATRIPSLNQPFQKKKIRNARVNENDSVALLKLFGNVTITNPFKLLAV